MNRAAPLSVAPEHWVWRFLRSWAGAFFLGFCSAAIAAGVLSGALHWPE